MYSILSISKKIIEKHLLSTLMGSVTDTQMCYVHLLKDLLFERDYPTVFSYMEVSEIINFVATI